MDRAPQAYEPTYEAQVPSTLLNTAFVRSESGILKTCEIILSCVVFICVACSAYWDSTSGGRFVNFVGALSFIVTTLLFIFYLFNLIQRFRGPWILLEFCALVVCAVFWFIGFAVAASHAKHDAAVTATAIFSFFAMVAYIIELVLRFRVTRENNVYRITMAMVRTVPPYPTGSVVPPTTQPAGPPATAPGGYPMNYPGATTDHDFVMP